MVNVAQVKWYIPRLHDFVGDAHILLVLANNSRVAEGANPRDRTNVHSENGHHKRYLWRSTPSL